MNKQTEEALRMAVEMLEIAKKETKTFDYIGYEKAINACKAALQEYALDRMAENARELGLEYCKHGSDSACKECYMENVEQEPVAWMDSEGRFRKDYKTEIVRSIAAVNKEIPLYTRPTKPLSDDEIRDCLYGESKTQDFLQFARAIEKAHGIGND